MYVLNTGKIKTKPKIFPSPKMRTLESKLKRPVGDYMRKAIDILPTTRTLDAFATMHEAQIRCVIIYAYWSVARQFS